MPVERVRTSRVVSAEEWGGAATLAAWVQSRGGSAIVAHHVGHQISTVSPQTILDTTLTDASAGWWREGAMAFAILVTGHREPDVVSYGGTIDVTASDGVTTYGTWQLRLDNTIPRQLRRFEIQHFDLAGRGGEIRLLVTAQASIAGLYVDLVQVMELPRAALTLDAADAAVLPASCGPHSPIYDVRHLSARGAVDAYLRADSRRQSYFHALSREAPIVIATSVTVPFTELWPLGIPLQGQIRAPGDTTTTEIVVAMDVRFDNAADPGNKATIRVATDQGGASIDTAVTSATWTTIVVRPAVAVEALDTVDGRLAGLWEMLRISAQVVRASGEPVLEIGTTSVHQVNAEGERAFSAGTYYQSASTADVQGSDTMTHTVMFRLDAISGFQTIWSKRASNSGWRWLVTNTGAVRFEYADGAVQHQILSAVLTAGRTYVASASWDGTNLRLVVNQVASTPVAGGAAYSPATIAVGLGASSGGGLPAANLTILGCAASSTVALSDAAMAAHNALCAGVGDVRPFVGCETLVSARFGLHVDLLGGVDFQAVGTTTRERLVPRVG